MLTNRCRPALLSLMSSDRSTTLGYNPPSILKLPQQQSDSWGYWTCSAWSGLVLERSRVLMTDSPTRSQVCLHNSCFKENIIKGWRLCTLPPLLPGDGKQAQDELYPWRLTCQQRKNSSPEVMDVSGPVSSCYHCPRTDSGVSRKIKISGER